MDFTIYDLSKPSQGVNRLKQGDTTLLDMFDKMLGEAQVVITPGSGFGSAGEGYFRISAFNSRANVEEVCRRLKELVA